MNIYSFIVIGIGFFIFSGFIISWLWVFELDRLNRLHNKKFNNPTKWFFNLNVGYLSSFKALYLNEYPKQKKYTILLWIYRVMAYICLIASIFLIILMLIDFNVI